MNSLLEPISPLVSLFAIRKLSRALRALVERAAFTSQPNGLLFEGFDKSVEAFMNVLWIRRTFGLQNLPYTIHRGVTQLGLYDSARAPIVPPLLTDEHNLSAHRVRTRQLRLLAVL